MDPWKQISRLSTQELRSLQNKKLSEFVRYQLYPFSPHYRQLFDRNKINPQEIQTVKDLHRIPFSAKADFLNAPPEKSKEFILQPDMGKIKKYWPPGKLMSLAFKRLSKGEEFIQDELGKEYRPIFMTFTTGTTNTPVSFLYSKYDIDNLYLSGSRMLKMFNIHDTDRIVNVFPFAPHLAFWQVVFGGLSSNVLILSTGGGKVLNSEANIAAILKTKPSVILGVPSYVYHLLRLAQEKNYNLSFVKKIVLGAAAVTEVFKHKLRNLLESMGAKDVYIFGTYGFTEARTAWAECPSNPGVPSGYHLYPDKEILEIIDPETGQVREDTSDGEIVYTSIDSRASSVIRYRTGDFVKGGISWETCPSCGRTVPRLSTNISRISDIQGLNLSKIKGSLVNLSHFGVVLNEFEAITEWQIEIKKKDNDPHEVDELIIHICANDRADKEKLKEDLKKKISAATEVTPNQIIFSSLPELVKRLELETASKEKRIVDNRPK